MGHRQRSVETLVLNRLSEVRDSVERSVAFIVWVRGLESVSIDGETFFVRGGDMLRDRDQVIFEWARNAGMLSDAEIQQALDNEG